MATQTGLGLSYVIYDVGSSETDFSIPATILTLEEFGVDIEVQFTVIYVDDNDVETELSAPDDWTWTGSVVRLTTARTGGTLEIKRVTKDDDAYVDFRNADNIDEEQFDFSKYHNFMLAQEGLDEARRALRLGTDLEWDAESLEIKRLADGTTTQSAVTLGQLLSQGGGGNVVLNGEFTYRRDGDGTVMGPGSPVDLADNTYLVQGDEADVDGNGLVVYDLFVSFNGVIFHTDDYTLDGTQFEFNTVTPGEGDQVEIRWLPGAVAVLLGDDIVGTSSIQDGAVTEPKLADDAVSADKLASDAVVTASIVDANVTAAKLAANAVTTAKVTDASITAAKLESGILDTGAPVEKTGRELSNASFYPTSHYQNTASTTVIALITIDLPNVGYVNNTDFELAPDDGGAPGAWTTVMPLNANASAAGRDMGFTLVIPAGYWIRVRDADDKSGTNSGAANTKNIVKWFEFTFGI